jgi:uncharacterized phage-associated protein
MSELGHGTMGIRTHRLGTFIPANLLPNRVVGEIRRIAHNAASHIKISLCVLSIVCHVSRNRLTSGKARSMPNVFDVAAYILQQKGAMTAMKLQKLVYYSQAWSLVWDEAPIFDEKIRAWANGPVVQELFFAHQGEYMIREVTRGDRSALTSEQRETIDSVLDHYGDKTAQWLSALTHREDPWRNAREGLSDGERGNAEISHGALADYYGNL